VKWPLLISLAALCPALPALAGSDPRGVPTYIAIAVADQARPASKVELDALRKPAELIAFSGLRPGERVADFMPGNAYFTRIFSRVVGPRGRVYAFLPAQELANCAPAETAGTKALETDSRYANVRVLIDAADRFAAPEPLDLVWTAQNYHDLHDKFMAPLDIARLNAAIFRALKPGGTFIVIDHAAAAGSALRDTETLHRIDPQSIIAEVTAAGFVLEAQSALLRNPNDTHALPVFDTAIRHHTDQVVLKFRKPLNTAAITSDSNNGSARRRQLEAHRG
jgi:predicted methyltransferase